MTINEDFIRELNRQMMRNAVPNAEERQRRIRYEEDKDNAWTCASWLEYLLTVVFSIILLFGVLILTVFWVSFYRGGFATKRNPETRFNIHPTLMVAGLITLSGFSVLLYRLCRCLKHNYVKVMHVAFHSCAIPCVVLGFMAVYEEHNLAPIPKLNFYSLHSWLGLITMGFFVLQFIIGFFSFVALLCCKDYTFNYRTALVPIHASFGLFNFNLAVATCLSGLVEMDRQLQSESIPSSYNTEMEHYIMNSLGIALVAIAIIVSIAVRRSNSPTDAKVYVTERF